MYTAYVEDLMIVMGSDMALSFQKMVQDMSVYKAIQLWIAKH